MRRKKKWLQWYDHLSPEGDGKRKKRVKKNEQRDK